ncbi:MAG: hypothetical protein ACR9NN_18725 [Nostochopsis sp.]
MIKITTLLPNAQQESDSRLTEEINLNHDTKNQIDKLQQFALVNFQREIQQNGTTASRNGSAQYPLRSESISTEINDSTALISHNKSSVALVDSTATALLSSEDTQNPDFSQRMRKSGSKTAKIYIAQVS